MSTTDRDSNVNGEREFKETMERRNAFSHYLPYFNKVFGIIYLIDYYLKCGIVEQKCKIKVTKKKSTIPILRHPEVEHILPKLSPADEEGRVKIWSSNRKFLTLEIHNVHSSYLDLCDIPA